MAVADDYYEPELFAAMARALDEAWNALETTTIVGSAADRDAILNIMAMRIVTAVDEGVRKSNELMILALHAIGAPAMVTKSGQPVAGAEIDQPIGRDPETTPVGVPNVPRASVEQGIADEI